MMGNFSKYQKELVSTPEKVFKTFFYTRSPHLVYETLWDIFRLAVNGGLEKGKTTYTDDVALLFDQITDLVAAAYVLYLADQHKLSQQEGTAHD